MEEISSRNAVCIGTTKTVKTKGAFAVVTVGLKCQRVTLRPQPTRRTTWKLVANLRNIMCYCYLSKLITDYRHLHVRLLHDIVIFILFSYFPSVICLLSHVTIVAVKFYFIIEDFVEIEQSAASIWNFFYYIRCPSTIMNFKEKNQHVVKCSMLIL